MKTSLIQQLNSGETAIAVVGLGYTGLPLALALAEYFPVIGYDVDSSKVSALAAGENLSVDFLNSSFRNNIRFVSDSSHLTAASLFIVSVPTPIDKQNNPDLGLLAVAMKQIGSVLKKGSGVIIESTVYPGCTEEFCVPLLEKASGLFLHQDFWVGYSPERINPGDAVHHVRNVIKLIAGSSADALDTIRAVYSKVVTAGLYACSSIKVAEAAKMTENIQRDVNIALLNELSAVYEKLGIDASSVWEAAATKWNFAPFRPGLAGGHCISVDPYYLIYKAQKGGADLPLVATARKVNEEIVQRVAKKVVDFLEANGVALSTSLVLVKGVSFKGNVSDIRNSKILEVVKLLREFGIQVDLEDPMVNSAHLKEVYGWELVAGVQKNYDVVIIAADHAVYTNLGEDYFCTISSPEALIIDLKGMYKGKITQRKYWSL